MGHFFSSIFLFSGSWDAIAKIEDNLDKLQIQITQCEYFLQKIYTTNIIWIEKEVLKGHLNLIAYTLPLDIDLKTLQIRIPKIRDSIGKIYVPGRLPNSYMITEKAYRPYFYLTQINEMESILTKGTWEVENDFMAGPFVNYIVKDTQNNRYLVLEGFAFAPTESKRNYICLLYTSPSPRDS